MVKYIIIIILSLICTTTYAIPKGWEYNYLSSPTQEHNKNELYDKQYQYYTWVHDKSEFNIQMHRFDKDAPFPEIIKNILM